MVKIHKRVQICLLAMSALIMVLQGCTPPAPGFYKDGLIPQDKRNDFHDLNKQLFKAILSGHEKEVDLMLSAELLASNYNADKVAYYLKSQNYSLLNEYYVVHKYQGRQHMNVDPQYNLDYIAVTEEMYMAFFLPKGGDDQYMISVVYSKYKYGWRVTSIGLEQYTINGKTAPQLYQQATAEYNQGYYTDALNTMDLATKCTSPSLYWQYSNEKKISDFYVKTIETSTAKCRFPIIVNTIPTAPQIIRVVNQSIPEGTFPAVYYQSKISLNDTAALRKENAALNKAIEHFIPGITKNKKYLLYSAFNELPTPAKYVKSYDVTYRLR